MQVTGNCRKTGIKIQHLKLFMSWDIILFNSKQKFETVEEIEDELLSETNFDKVLLEKLSPTKIEDENVDVENKNYALNFFLDNELVTNKMVTLYNENALYELVRISKEMSWQIFDTSSGEMINLENPEKNGYESFQKYLKSILYK